ncbi:MAG: tRNA 2-thiouridine(34) synthase MnmA [Gemmatimonadetes bacterium]|nr:MAG: tRNA 2-thiouridine(34) synthase MnmA [Gemmatimonadota bacterium]
MTKRSIVVAMSGGVDSCVAAALLVEQGYDVLGMTMKTFCYGSIETTEKSCCSIDSINDAKSVCRQLGIRHHVIDEVETFQSTVIDNFVNEYAAGRTPNPCVICNSQLKFWDLLIRARQAGYDKVATGHYARIRYNEVSGRWELLKGRDEHKDQTYFLWDTSQEQLAHTVLPLGELTKPEVRHLARKYGFRTATKPESQEICFIPDNDTRGFLKRQLGDRLQPGEIQDEAGNVLGMHEGTPLYTIGQRKGLKLAVGRPVYVKRIDPQNNVVVVADDDALYQKELVVERTNWISIKTLEKPLTVTAKIRYRHHGDQATLYPLDAHRARVVFETPQRAITPGQSAVFYQADVVIGGGLIASEPYLHN